MLLITKTRVAGVQMGISTAAVEAVVIVLTGSGLRPIPSISIGMSVID